MPQTQERLLALLAAWKQGMWAGPASASPRAQSSAGSRVLSGLGWEQEQPGGSWMVRLDVTHLPEATQRVPVARMGPAGDHGKEDQGMPSQFPLLSQAGSPKYVTPCF